MRSYAQNFLRGLFLIGFVAAFSVWQQHENDWDYFVYAQQWPVAACVDINNSEGKVCIFPSIVKTWTVHGLWPSSRDGEGPFYCNDSSPFIENAIKDLEPEMMARWPNLIEDSGKTSFWKHEWEKHGTCAASLPSIGDQHGYFQKSLQLNSQINLLKILSISNITPSASTTYKLDQIRSAIETYTKSAVILECIFAENDNVQALIQVEICLDKSYQPIDCSDDGRKYQFLSSSKDIPYNPSFEHCSDDVPVQYLPLPHSA